MRGPYAVVQKMEKVEFSVNLNKDLYFLMMKQIQSEENPNRSRWVREAIRSKLGIDRPTDGEFQDWDNKDSRRVAIDHVKREKRE